MGAGFGFGLAVFLAGLVVTFAGGQLRGRVLGLSTMALGALLTVVTAPPRPSWAVATTVALTLVPLIAMAVVLHRVLRARVGRAPSLDDDPW